jgi:hypothetical protein
MRERGSGTSCAALPPSLLHRSLGKHLTVTFVGFEMYVYIMLDQGLWFRTRGSVGAAMSPGD